MIFYVVIFTIVIILAMLSQKEMTKSKKFLFAFLSLFIIFLISAIRYDVGTDYFYRYVPDFNTILMGGDVLNLEIGFKILIKICLLFTKDVQLLFVLTSLIIVFGLGYLIYKYSKKPALSLFLFFAGSFFFQSLNVVRQYIAIVLIFSFYFSFLDKNYLKSALSIFLASLFHTTSLICLFTIFYTKKIFTNIYVVLGLLCIILIFSNQIGDLINIVISHTRFKVYINSKYDVSRIKYLTLLLNLFVYVVCYLIYRKNNLNDRVSIFFLNLLGSALLCTSAGKVISLATRLSYYFNVFQIFAIPYFLNIESKSESKNKIFNKKYLTILVILAFMCNIFYTNVLHNDDEVIPYQTVYNL